MGWSPEATSCKEVLIAHHIRESGLFIIGAIGAGKHVTITRKRYRHHRSIEISRELSVETHDIVFHLYHLIPFVKQLNHLHRTSSHHLFSIHIENLLTATQLQIFTLLKQFLLHDCPVCISIATSSREATIHQSSLDMDGDVGIGIHCCIGSCAIGGIVYLIVHKQATIRLHLQNIKT